VASPDLNVDSDGTGDALHTFLVNDWLPDEVWRATPPTGEAMWAGRRSRLSDRLPGLALVIPCGGESIRVNDTTHHFRPASDFTYLLGPGRPDDVLVLFPETAGHRACLYTREGTEWGRWDTFADRQNGAVWVGPRPSLQEMSSGLGLDVLPLHRLEADLRSCRTPAVIRGVDATVDATLAPRAGDDGALAAAVAELRLVKDPSEQEAIRAAVAVTIAAFREVVRNLRPGVTERDIEVDFDAAARRRGNGTGYSTIVAAGRHATVRHWIGTRYRLRADDLVLIDAGVEVDSLYTADITRTLPVSGRFTVAQRAIYEVVAAAQSAAIDAARPGLPFSAMHTVATRLLAEGLVNLGLVKESAEALCDPANPRYRRYCGQRVSHMLGLDVHDCSAARPEAYAHGRLASGMVMTVEPGIYFLPGDGSVPAEFRGIGVRIEDDILITAAGCDVLSSELPAGAEEVEAWVRSAADPG